MTLARKYWGCRGQSQVFSHLCKKKKTKIYKKLAIEINSTTVPARIWRQWVKNIANGVLH